MRIEKSVNKELTIESIVSAEQPTGQCTVECFSTEKKKKSKCEVERAK